ncbi:hypothetical protein BRAS3809_3710001 [Bradyrhizobium sp. STM 3809]|nr:hypothetical protein BRAS3809_3710001 [Bradyrhizobium sp. STM 3809]
MQWIHSIVDVCTLYDLPAAPETARQRMRDYADEIGRCADAPLDAVGALVATMASAPAEYRSIAASMKSNPQQMVTQTVEGVLATVQHPEATDTWRRARLPALTALAERLRPLLTADERRPIVSSLEAASRAARDPQFQAGLANAASRLNAN